MKKYRVINENGVFYPQERIFGLFWKYFGQTGADLLVWFTDKEKAVEFCSKQMREDGLPKLKSRIVWKSHE